MIEQKIERIDKAIKLLRDLKKNSKRMRALSQKDLMQMTPKQAQNRNADSTWLAMDNTKIEHELHALAVELGFAERRVSYEAITFDTGWQKYNYTPREPFN